MRLQRVTTLLMSLLLVAQTPARAEDIDVFSLPPGTASAAPNVLFLIDNTANWNTAFTNEKAALVNVFNGLPTNPDGTAKFNVGIMLFTETGNPNSNVDGGYVRAAVRPMNETNQGIYSALINSFDKLGDKSNGGKAGLTMAEAYYYFSSANPRSGKNKAKTDYTGNTSGTSQSNAVYALGGNALTGFASQPYNGPSQADCAKNYIIYISNGAAQDNNSDTTTATSLLSALGGSTTALPISPSGSQTNVADEWARFMKQSPEQITLYTLDIDKVTNGQGPGWTALLKSMAAVSGGKYFDVSSGVAQNIVDALNTALSEILAANSVFASVSLPASANTQSTFLNQVFIGMFRPDPNAMARWNGNLKQYKLGISGGDVKLLDAATTQAINPSTGFITECARSYWTPTAVDTYWAHSPQGDCLAVANSKASNYPDGPLVEKGAQGYILRSSTTRTVKTCSATFGSCTGLTNFEDGNAAITKTLLGNASMTNATRTNMINWARGLDTGVNPPDERVNGVTSAEMRASAHGDVVHSRPVAINYGTDADPKVVVFYSGNDGMLRAINGNRSASIGSPVTASTHTAGKEMWSFVPPEFWGQIKRLYENNVQISYPAVTTGSPLPKPYGIDGPITAYKGDVSGTPKVFLYAGMRRGGRALYAFDVTTPDTPVLKWKRGCPNQANDTDCTNDGTNGDWRGIGQTWSNAVPVRVENYAKPVLLMGGGYDSCEDYDGGAGGATHNCSSTKGNRIYVIDADTGVLLQTFTTDRAVSAAITPVLSDDDDGYLEFAYAADTAGNLYRIAGAAASVAIGNTAPGSWTITKIASLGCDTVAACTQQRKFLFQPDVVRNGQGFWIMVGSGDREKPLETYVAASEVQNHFFAVRDEPTVSSWLADEASGARCSAALLCLASLAEVPSDPTQNPDMSGKKGWYLPLAATESVVTSAITVTNRLTFSTFKPAGYDALACGPTLGESNVYNLLYDNAAPFHSGEDRFEPINGGGLPPSPVAGKVILDDGTTVPFLIGGSADSPLEATNPNTASDFEQPKTRVYWHIQK